MKTEYTSGLWHTTGNEIRANSGLILAKLYEHLPINQSIEEARSNLRLMAAAPELLEALENVQRDINWMLNNRQFLNQDVFNYLDEAIKKAKGE